VLEERVYEWETDRKWHSWRILNPSSFR
jgi:hypothetical protein